MCKEVYSGGVVICLVIYRRHFEWKILSVLLSLRMVKNCCAVDCSRVYTKRSGVSFHLFPADPDQRRHWIAAVCRKNWELNEYTWLCSQHFVTGKKSDDPLAPNYIASIFQHVPSPVKCSLDTRASVYSRRKGARKRRMAGC